MLTDTPAATKTTISSVCHKCGIIVKSGEPSCCGRSGSWFGNCGRAGNAKLDHTWYEGIRACKTWSQSKAAQGHQLHAAQQKNTDFSSNHADIVNSRSVIMPANTSAPTAGTTLVIMLATASINIPAHISMTYTSTNTAMTSPALSQTSASSSATSQRCERVVGIITHISFLITIIVSDICYR